ncbi:MAG: aldehyde dehydrogenase, partial [Verrucomicrobia bacterium]
MAQQKEIISTVNSLIETLKDGQEGFKQAADAVK